MHFGGVGQKYPSLIWPKNKARWGCGAKIIFPQFDTIIITFMYHFLGDESDKLS
jgi:hypothetical protein